MSDNAPSYLTLLQNNQLSQRVEKAFAKLKQCNVCAWGCQANRLEGKLGICQTGELARVSSYGAHRGEENPISGWRGSGTIFFSRCNMRCQYCQNAEISQTNAGTLMTPDEIAAIMLELQAYGCHNINLVSPSHVAPQILAAVYLAAQQGLRLPLVYNSGGYDSVEMLQLLDGVMDIYMPDMKYGSSQIARHYSKVRNYTQINQAAVKEMHHQVGDLQISEQGLATRGLLIRHLVLPYDLARTEEVVRFIVQEISINTYINIMGQYHPAFNAAQHPKLKRAVTHEEVQSALQLATQAGLSRFSKASL
jgi:putative pyruvate formate lyase activating enzyme